ncbi:formate dehydrogenase subunit gamma [Sabulicella rubraurantiaca]|uniref:formate dehydrogenase subunit gamma n=1 Tax=Sabulicella rubraurantiaca TaxID=2811429 RepID=UPI001A979B65|nr:formate dehydrogenase subunit gamma [Sabulicella rubraurantiaca]
MRGISSLLLAALLLAAPVAAQTVAPSPAMPTERPHPGASDVQSAAPGVGESRGDGQPARQNPETADPQRPTGTAPGPVPQQAAPTPTAPIPAPPPMTARGPSADELELQRTLQGGRIEGRVTIPNQAAGVLVQPEGRSWRQFHNVTLNWVGGIAVGGMLLILVAFFLVRGRMVMTEGRSGRTIQRFNALERANHWMVASSFIVLGLSGLNITFGRYLLLPLIGPEAFYILAQYGKIAHNFLAFPFTLGLIVMLLLWVRDNIPDRTDIEWVKSFGGLFGGAHPRAGRFNAGQKVVFWITVLGGGLVAASGYFLIFPFWGPLDVNDMQLAHIVHSVLSVLMVAAMLAHIYIGSIGMEGAYDAMGSGQVDLNWAREHHSLWVEDEMAKARQVVAPAGARPAGD